MSRLRAKDRVAHALSLCDAIIMMEQELFELGFLRSRQYRDFLGNLKSTIEQRGYVTPPQLEQLKGSAIGMSDWLEAGRALKSVLDHDCPSFFGLSSKGL